MHECGDKHIHTFIMTCTVTVTVQLCVITHLLFQSYRKFYGEFGSTKEIIGNNFLLSLTLDQPFARILLLKF